MADWRDLLGMTLDEAIDRAAKYDHKIRVSKWNNAPGVGTRDVKTNRVNVDVERHPDVTQGDWRVVKVRGVG